MQLGSESCSVNSPVMPKPAGQCSEQLDWGAGNLDHQLQGFSGAHHFPKPKFGISPSREPESREGSPRRGSSPALLPGLGAQAFPGPAGCRDCVPYGCDHDPVMSEVLTKQVSKALLWQELGGQWSEEGLA